MEGLKGELVRITTADNLELHGLLYEPENKNDKALIHVHGLVGNFYENLYLELIRNEAIASGFAFLSFNNRGTGFVEDLIKRKKTKIEYARIGGCLEKFEDCILDIKAAVDFLSGRGYKEIILEGHSAGCQKIAFYKHRTKDKRVKGLVFLAPVDDIGYVKRHFGKKYEKALKTAKDMAAKGKAGSPVPKWMEFYPLFSARVFLSVSDPNSSSGRIFDYSGKLKEIKNIECPVLALFGSKDEYEYKPQEKLEILKEKAKDCDTALIKNARHGFAGYEAELAKVIGMWLGDKISRQSIKYLFF